MTTQTTSWAHRSPVTSLLAVCLCASFSLTTARAAAEACERDSNCKIGEVCQEKKCVGWRCPELYSPVCGTDGKTYSNPCQARLAHVAVKHTGECGVAPTRLALCGAHRGSCPGADTFCEEWPGVCGAVGDPGVCMPRPNSCGDDAQLVCGCDSKTYLSDCVRQKHGIAKRNDGPCTATPWVTGAEALFPESVPGFSEILFVRGVVSKGVERGCQVLMTKTAKRYTFSSTQIFPDGQELCVVGKPMDASICMQGTPLDILAAERCATVVAD